LLYISTFIYNKLQALLSQSERTKAQLIELAKSAISNRGPIEAFVRPSWGFHCRKSILHTDNVSLFW